MKRPLLMSVRARALRVCMRASVHTCGCSRVRTCVHMHVCIVHVCVRV